MKSLHVRVILFSTFIVSILMPALVWAAVVNLDCLTSGGNNCPSGPGSISSALPPVVSTINVPAGTCSNVLDVNVSVDITHSDAIEYAISVDHNGVNVGLYDADCDGEEDMLVTYDDSGGNMVCQTPISGTYKPNSFLPGSLPDFNGASGDGDWNLTVTGDSSRWVGELNNWGISVTCSGSLVIAESIPASSWWGTLILFSTIILTAWLGLRIHNRKAA